MTTDEVRVTLFHKFQSRVSYSPWILQYVPVQSVYVKKDENGLVPVL